MELFKSKYEGFLSITTLFYIVSAFLVSVLVVIIKLLGRDPKHVQFASKLKGPRPVPFFGNSLQFLSGGKSAPVTLLSHWREKYGPIYRLWFGNDLMVVISDVSYLKDIFRNEKLKYRGPSYRAFTNFLLNRDATEDDIIQMKKTVESHFSSHNMQKFVTKMNERIAQLTDDLQRESRGEFDVEDIIFDTVFDIFTNVEYDYVMDSATKAEFDMKNKIHRAAQILSLPVLFPGMKSNFFQYIIGNILNGRLKKNYHDYAQLIANDKLSSILNDTENSTNQERRKSSYLWNMLQKTDNLDKNGRITIEHNTGAFLFAGIDPISLVVSFSLLMIAMHRDVQDKLHQEINEVFGDDDRRATYDDIQRLSYLDKVIKETMRLNSIIGLLIRYVSDETRIGPHIFPKGSHLMINFTGINLDEKLYLRPSEFNPDNFNEEAVAKRPPYSFVPFSAGLRVCLGQSYANIEMKLMLVAILRKFILRTSLKLTDIKYHYIFATCSAVGYPIHFVSRK